MAGRRFATTSPGPWALLVGAYVATGVSIMTVPRPLAAPLLVAVGLVYAVARRSGPGASFPAALAYWRSVAGAALVAIPAAVAGTAGAVLSLVARWRKHSVSIGASRGPSERAEIACDQGKRRG